MSTVTAPPPQHMPASTRGRRSAFGEGFAAPREGFVYMCRHPGLWRYAVIPILLNILITALVLGLLVAAAVYFTYRLHPRFAGGWGWRALEVVVVLALIAAAAATMALHACVAAGAKQSGSAPPKPGRPAPASSRPKAPGTARPRASTCGSTTVSCLAFPSASGCCCACCPCCWCSCCRSARQR